MNSQNWPIHQLPGLELKDQQKLQQIGIHTTFDLIKRGQTEPLRLSMAQALMLHIKHVNKWVALARLAGVPSVGIQYCGLLLHAGISHPQQLTTIPVERLHRQLQQLQIRRLSRTDLCPSLGQVIQWIDEAKTLMN